MARGKERLHTPAGADVQRIDPGSAHRQVGQREGGLPHPHNVFPINGTSVLPVVAHQQPIAPADPDRRPHPLVTAREQARADQGVHTHGVQRGVGLHPRNRRSDQEQLHQFDKGEPAAWRANTAASKYSAPFGEPRCPVHH